MYSSILHITPSYKPAYVYGGAIVSGAHLCESLVSQNATVTVLTTTANGSLELPRHYVRPVVVDGVFVYYFSRWTKDHSHFSPALLWFLWRKAHEYNVVHIHSWWNLVAILSVCVCLLRGKKPIVTPRGMLSPYTLSSRPKRWFHRFLGQYLLARTYLHATAEQEWAECQTLIPNWAGFTLPNIIDLPSAPPERVFGHLNAEESPLRLVYLSRIHHKKGLNLLFEALSKVTFPWELTIAGDGEEEEIDRLKGLAHFLAFGERLQWAGWVGKDQKFDFLARYDVMVLTSRNENFANVVLESLSVGTPVLVSDQVGLSTYVSENGVGWVSDLRPSSLQACLERVYSERGSLAAMGATAASVVQRDFNRTVVAQRYLDAYRHLAP